MEGGAARVWSSSVSASARPRTPSGSAYRTDSLSALGIVSRRTLGAARALRCLWSSMDRRSTLGLVDHLAPSAAHWPRTPSGRLVSSVPVSTFSTRVLAKDSDVRLPRSRRSVSASGRAHRTRRRRRQNRRLDGRAVGALGLFAFFRSAGTSILIHCLSDARGGWPLSLRSLLGLSLEVLSCRSCR